MKKHAFPLILNILTVKGRGYILHFDAFCFSRLSPATASAPPLLFLWDALFNIQRAFPST